MEYPVQVAVRVYDGRGAKQEVRDAACVWTGPLSPVDNVLQPSSGLVHVVGNNTFPVMHALPADTGQNQVYQRTVMPMLMLFLEGFDASVLTYGHSKTGKR